MANNVNTNLTQRIFAYISHSSDLNDRLAQVYNNSLIFVGDEKQIYVPKFGAYVGVGMTSYNDTIGRIDNIATQLAELKKTMNETAVKKLYIDFGVSTQYGSDVISGSDIFTPSYMGANIQGDPVGLTGEIVITGKADMNPDTFFKNDSLYTYSGDDWVKVKSYSDANAAPTSGIRISYTSEITYVTLEGGITAQQPYNQRLVIDDSLTWSYMTNAYAYTLGFAKDYTSHEIETLYQTLLGIGESVLMPVSEESLWNTVREVVDGEVVEKTVWTGGTVYYRTTDGAALPYSADDFTALKAGNFTGWASWDGTGTKPTPADGEDNFYKIITNYQDSYNTNISDGIQTLKEVAHVLDIITDGGLGTVTYITSAQWDSLGLNDVTPTNNAYTRANDNVVYHRVITNGVPTTNPSSYGWYITVDPENLGIQMATSIAGNTAAINDLHDHVQLAEEGSTTLRSLSQYNPSEFITLSQWSNKAGLSVTDTNESLPNATKSRQTSYMIGDVKTMTSLTVSTTYITYNGSEADYANTALNGEERIGLYQLVDLTKWPAFEAGKYFKWTGTTMEAVLSTEWVDSSNPDSLYDTTGNLKKYYTQNTGTTAEAHINDTFTWAPQAFVNEHTTETFYTYNTETGKYVELDRENDTDINTLADENVKKYYITSTGVGKPYVLHANINESNRLATTAWTMALVDDRNSSLQSELDNILENANRYTDEKIDALDANYKYRDFNAYFNSLSASNGLIPGTTAYKTLWNEQYTAWTTDKDNNSFVGDHDQYVANVSYNRVRSEFITNVIEENGLVTAESRELPTDQLQLSYTIWNTQREGAQFTPITLNGDGNETNDVALAGLEGLFAFVYNNGNTPKEIYYSVGETYVPWTYTNEATITNVYKINENGEYVSVGAESGTPIEYVIKHNITNSPHWPGKMYTKSTAYYEVNVASITVSNDGNKAEYITSFEYMGPNGLTIANGFTSESQPTFYAKNVNNATEVKYLSGRVDHFSYEGDGEGQNRFYIDAHITHIEDAAHDNTGLADAYDVQNYIQNMFSWVNISASIDSVTLSKEPDFYTVFSTKASSDSNVQSLISGKTLYYKNNDTFVELTNPVIGHFGKNSAGQIEKYNENTSVQGSDWYEVCMNASATAPLIVYECNETVFTNPMNMTLHKI